MPAILVPWPGAAENHQIDNARQLSDHGAAILVEQPDLTADRLVAEIDRLQRRPRPALRWRPRSRAATSHRARRPLIDGSSSRRAA